MNSYQRVCATGALCLASLMGAACGDRHAESPATFLMPMVEPDLTEWELLLPRAIVHSEGDLLIVEEGRRTLTRLSMAGTVRERRPIWLDHPGFPSVSGSRVGAAAARDPAGTWVLVEGVGPVYLADDGSAPDPLGAGSLGALPGDGLEANAVDWTATVGLTVDRDARLVVAVSDRVFRIDDGVADLIAGGGDGPVPGPALDMDLRFDSGAGLAFGPAGELFVGDSATGLLIQIDPDGTAQTVAGGGDNLSIGSAPSSATSAVLELSDASLVWDDDHAQLAILEVRRVILLDPAAGTIRTLEGATTLPGGLVSIGESLVISSRWGGVQRFEAESSSDLVLRPETRPDLGRADALVAVGTSSFAMRDPGTGRWSLSVPEEGVFTLVDTRNPRAPPTRVLAADDRAFVYYLTTVDLRRMEVNSGFGLVGRRRASPVFEGQTLARYPLPMEGELQWDQGTLWVLDSCRGILLRVATDTGVIEVVAGSTSGGSFPLIDRRTNLTSLNLEAPTHMVVGGQWVALVDNRGDGDRLYVLNTAAEASEWAGLEVDAGQTALIDLDTSVITALASSQGSLFVGFEDDDAQAAIVRIATDGTASNVPNVPEDGATALLALSDDLLLIGSSTGVGTAVNLGTSDASVLGVSIAAGASSEIVALGAGIRELSGDADRVLALDDVGWVHTIGASTAPILEIAGQAIDLAVGPDGLALALIDGALHGAGLDGPVEFLDWSVPVLPGEELMSPVAGWLDGSPVSTMSFGDNITALAIGPDGSLFILDHELQGLLRAQADDDGRVRNSSATFLESRGDPLPLGQHPLSLQIDADGRPVLARQDALYRLEADQWRLLLGGGEAAPEPGREGGEAHVSHITGVAFDGQSTFVRAREGLVTLDQDGAITQVVESLGSPPLDPGLTASARSIAWIDGGLHLLFGGGVYRLVGEP